MRYIFSLVILTSLLMGCNKSTPPQQESASAPVPNKSGQISENAKVLSTTLSYMALITAIESHEVIGEGKSCLMRADDQQLAQSLQAMFDQHLSVQESQAFERLYANGFGERLRQYIKVNMLAKVGESNEQATLSDEDQQRLNASHAFPEVKALERAMPQDEINKLTVDLVTKELARCQIAQVQPTSSAE